jgi:flagellar biosynthetic protein FlhB
MSGDNDDQDKSFDPTPEKLRKARAKGDIARSVDLSVAAGYGGLLLAAMAAGTGSVIALGSVLIAFIDRPDRLAPLFFDGATAAPFAGLMTGIGTALAPWFLAPAAAVILSILAQRGFAFAPDKLQFKASRLSILSNARNKFGRNGLFEFSKSFVKLLLYSVCLTVFLAGKMPEILALTGTGPHTAVAALARLSVEFLFLVLVIAAGLGAVDAVWQHAEHRRKNRMSRKEMQDEAKDAEGDPHMKQHRRQRGQEIAMSQMMADVPAADVVIVNPTHFAVALKWSRQRGAAPVCVAKGVDETAATIRRIAAEAGVPIHHDPPTARALHATVEVGAEIAEDQYRAVAAAIRFADRMRSRARAGFR